MPKNTGNTMVVEIDDKQVVLDFDTILAHWGRVDEYALRLIVLSEVKTYERVDEVMAQIKQHPFVVRVRWEPEEQP